LPDRQPPQGDGSDRAQGARDSQGSLSAQVSPRAGADDHFLALLLAAGAIASERDENAIGGQAD
jgi:hypothetical protein